MSYYRDSVEARETAWKILQLMNRKNRHCVIGKVTVRSDVVEARKKRLEADRRELYDQVNRMAETHTMFGFRPRLF